MMIKSNYDPDSVRIWTKDNDTIPANITLSFYPKDRIFIDKVRRLINELKVHDPELLWYEPWQYHLTLLTLLPKEIVGQTLEETNEFVKKIRSVIPSTCTENCVFSIKDVIMNNSFTSITAYPENFDLAKLRKEIREIVGVSGKAYEPDFEKIGWLCLVRYPKLPNEAVVEKIRLLGNYDLGSANFGINITEDVSVIHRESREIAKI